MNIIFTVLTVLALCAGPAIAKDLIKLNLDNVSALGLTIQADSQVKSEGKSSVRITTMWPTTVCLGEVTGLDLENARIRYTAKVKSDLKGMAFLEMWAHIGGGQYFSKGMNDPVQGKSEWRSIQTPFIFREGQKPDKVTLNIVINGAGTVWVDDVVLSKAPLK